MNIVINQELEIFVFLDVEKEMRRNKTKKGFFVVQVVFKNIRVFRVFRCGPLNEMRRNFFSKYLDISEILPKFAAV